MSTLEQIRQRPILIISILGLALLLFILTAVDRPGELFSDNHTVAKVDGEKIDYMDFQRRVEQQQEQMQQRGYNNVEIAQIQEYVLQQMLNEKLLEKEYSRLGLIVTDKELSEALYGENPHPYVNQMVQSWGIPSARDLYDAANNPQKLGIDPQQTPQLQQALRQLEDQVEKMLLESKFMNLFAGTLVANKLDAQAMFEDGASRSTIVYAKTDFASLNDDDFPVSDQEINEAYADARYRFPITQKLHMVNYVMVPVAPSAADLDAASKEVEDAVMALRANEGTEGLASNSKFYVNRVQAPAGKLAPTLRNKVTSMAKDSVAVISFVDNRYTIAKVLDVTTSLDSALVDVMFLNTNANADSLIASLNTGAKASDLGEALLQSQDSIWVSVLDPAMAAMKDEIEGAETGKYFAVANNNGMQGMTMRVRSRKPAVTLYDVAEVTYDVNPSNTTIADLNNSLNTFLTENKTAAAFAENAAKAGYTLMNAMVTPATLSINNIPESRGAAKWALDAKKGEVSKVYNDDRNTHLLAVAVSDIYDGKFLPATDERVKTYLTNKIRNEKKGAKLVADFAGKGKTVAEYAAAMKTSADTTDVNFASPYIRSFGMGEGILQANVAAAKQGELVGPVALNNSVVVFSVTAVDKTGREFNFDQDALSFNRSQGAASFQQSLPDVLLGTKKIDYRIQKFYADR